MTERREAAPAPKWMYRWWRSAGRVLAARVGRLVDGYPVRSAYGPVVRADLRDATNRASVLGCPQLDFVLDAVRAVRPGDCFIDVGANLGICSLVAARAVAEHGCVIAFEPHPTSYAALVRNLALNHATNVLALPVAVAESSRRSVLVGHRPSHSGLASLRHAAAEPSGTPAWCASFVDMTFLEAAIGDRRITVKIDVEGYEVRVLAALAAAPFAARVDRLIVEVSDSLLERFGETRGTLLAAAGAMGFTPTIRSDRHHYDEILVRQDPCVA